MTRLKFGRKWTLALVSGLAVLGLLLGGVSPAFAQETTPPAPDRARQGARLERLLQREMEWLAGQTNHIAKAGDVAARTQAFIDKASGEGKDTRALEAGLAAFRTEVAEAQAAHDEAQALLDAKAGFDADGKVTDPQLARWTVADAGQALREAHFILRQAERDLRQAVREFRRANRPQPAVTP